MIKKSASGLVYIGNYKSGRVEPKMEHLVSNELMHNTFFPYR